MTSLPRQKCLRHTAPQLPGVRLLVVLKECLLEAELLRDPGGVRDELEHVDTFLGADRQSGNKPVKLEVVEFDKIGSKWKKLEGSVSEEAPVVFRPCRAFHRCQGYWQRHTVE